MKSKNRLEFFPLLNFKLIPIVIMVVFLQSCKKDWLNAKSDSQLSVLTNLSDLQSLSVNGIVTGGNYLCEAGTDNYYVNPSNASFLGANDLIDYIWAPNGYATSGEDNWHSLYQEIYSCNAVLAGLKNITINPANLSQYNQVYGTALFYRATAFYNLSQTFIKAYDPSSANTNPGIPLRLQADVAQKIGRGTVQQVYNQIFTDLSNAIKLLPSSLQTYKISPTKQCALATLARIYLSISDYPNARLYADSSLKINNKLLDYNTLQPQDPTLPMPDFQVNPEVITYQSIETSGLNSPYVVSVDSILYQSYSSNDLRKTLFFTASSDYETPYLSFVGSYDGVNENLFTGVANDELYLIRAECEARLGDTKNAMNDLNTLLVNRYKSGTFTPLTAATATDALTTILTERRKELVSRAIRWSDLRRLNKDPNYAVNVVHVENGQKYTLTPGSNLYVWPIPQDEIIYSGIAQNPR